jgi:glycosyltransferase involved in cell wall biosynthesis
MKVLIAVIAYNEEDSIEKTLRDLLSNNCGYDVVVVDNGSSDRTQLVCRQMGVKTISHCVNSGSSMGTVMTYFLYAHRANYDVLCQFDGDGQHLAAELPKIIEPVVLNQADYVIGSRFLEKVGFQSTFLRRLGIGTLSHIDSWMIGQPVTDVTSGFRAYGRKPIEFFAKYYKHELSDTSQLLLLSHFAGARIKEVPVRMKEREFGNSEFTAFHSMGFMLKGFVNVVGCKLQQKQIQRFVKVYHGS